ncbi:hypothetical protein D3C80_1278320 [compost metagenome]
MRLEVSHPAQLIVLEYVWLRRCIRRLDEAGDIDGGQAVAILVFQHAVVVEHARCERGGAEQRAQFLDVVQVVEGDGPAEGAQDVVQVACAGGRLPRGIGVDVQQ